MINLIFSISFYIAIGFIFYILLKRRAFFSLSVLGLYFLYHLFIFILVTFDESFFWGLIATSMSLLFWSWLFLLFFVPALLFDFWKARKVAIQDSQPKSNQRQKIYLMIIIFLILISIGGVFYFFNKKGENISIKNKQNEESSQSSDKNIIKDFGDTGIIVISPEHNQAIFSPLKITGYIDDFGDGWEADFGSVELVDGKGSKLASAQLRVDATDDEGNYKDKPYYFESTLAFDAPRTEEGILKFAKHCAKGADCGSGFSLPVRFEKKQTLNFNDNNQIFEFVKKAINVYHGLNGVTQNPASDYLIETTDLPPKNQEVDYIPAVFNILKKGEIIGSFEGNINHNYSVIFPYNKVAQGTKFVWERSTDEEKPSNLLIASYCLGNTGSKCNGTVATYNFVSGELNYFIDDADDLFLSSDYLIILRTNDFKNYKISLLQFATGNILEQSVNLFCAIGANKEKGCRDIFIESPTKTALGFGEILYYPIDYFKINNEIPYNLFIYKISPDKQIKKINLKESGEITDFFVDKIEKGFENNTGFIYPVKIPN